MSVASFSDLLRSINGSLLSLATAGHVFDGDLAWSLCYKLPLMASDFRGEMTVSSGGSAQ